MLDIYTAKAGDLNEYVQAFECTPQQRGSRLAVDATRLDLMSFLVRVRMQSFIRNWSGVNQ